MPIVSTSLSILISIWEWIICNPAYPGSYRNNRLDKPTIVCPEFSVKLLGKERVDAVIDLSLPVFHRKNKSPQVELP